MQYLSEQIKLTSYIPQAELDSNSDYIRFKEDGSTFNTSKLKAIRLVGWGFAPCGSNSFGKGSYVITDSFDADSPDTYTFTATTYDYLRNEGTTYSIGSLETLNTPAQPGRLTNATYRDTSPSTTGVLCLDLDL